MWMARTSVDILDVVACLTVLPVLPCPAEIPAMQPCLHFREEISYFQDQSFLGRSWLIWINIGLKLQSCTPTHWLGTIQVLRHHDFDIFWPTHPPYHQTSSFPIPTLNMTSSFPLTHPLIYRFFFLSPKLDRACFIEKKTTYILILVQVFLKKIPIFLFCAHKQSFFPCTFFAQVSI